MMYPLNEDIKSQYIAGDYKDDNTQFTVGIDDGHNGKSMNSLYIIPYKSDSVYVGGGIGINQTGITNNVPIILKVGEKEFSAKVDLENYIVAITELTKYLEPDVELVNDDLPNVPFSLLYGGGKNSFTYYEHKCPYIYVEFWGTWCRGCYQAMDDLKELYSKYPDKLAMISIAFNEPAGSTQTIDTNDIRKVVEQYQLKWTQGIADKRIRRLFYLNYAPCGILYSNDGTVIKREIGAKELMQFLDEKYHKN